MENRRESCVVFEKYVAKLIIHFFKMFLLSDDFWKVVAKIGGDKSV